jgi:hypothetical protein
VIAAVIARTRSLYLNGPAALCCCWRQTIKLCGGWLAPWGAATGAGSAYCGLLKRFDRCVTSFLGGFETTLGLD